MSTKEIEIKLKTDKPESIKTKALELGFTTICPEEHEYNIVFDTASGQYRTNRQLLRLRKSGNRSTITFKSPLKNQETGNYKIREELECQVDNFESMRIIFSRMGYSEVFIYEKYREVLKKGDVYIMLDNTPAGSYIEIEGSPSDIDTTARDLGFSNSDYILTNYLKIWKDMGFKGNMVFTK